MQDKKNEMYNVYNGKMYANSRMVHSYNFIYKNCSTIVARNIKSRWGRACINPIKIKGYAKNIYWTPKDIAQLCNEQRINNMAVKVRGLDCSDKLKLSFKALIGLR
ncbi:hypothetical protein A9255_14080 [Xenorhabdus hominickii]|uniref:DUF4105 domain-containing protein n=1 Tax=Xenorhabdus hominickii TaxID=351679 RepID=A0ABM6DU89_XENHO|nr:hypothetical protein A9255_14080 [Xenorhabdus hominickii]